MEKPTYEQLLEYYETSHGCFFIDRDPNEVDIEWIRANAYQQELVPVDKLPKCIFEKDSKQ
jgi:hypothetical protein